LSTIEAVCLSSEPIPHIMHFYDFWFLDNDGFLPSTNDAIQKLLKHEQGYGYWDDEGAEVKEIGESVMIRMERCTGTLDDYLRSFPQHKSISALEVAEIMIQILTGLYHMQGLGFVHYDLKPSNSTYLV
jgi:serine/threonine protein kinase